MIPDALEWLVNNKSHRRGAPSRSQNVCFSIAGAKRNVGGVGGFAKFGKAAALRNRAASKKTMQILVSTLDGELPIESAGRGPRKSRQAMFQMVIAKVNNHGAVFVVQADPFVFCELCGFVPVPVLVIQFCQANTGVLIKHFGVQRVGCKLGHGVILNEVSKRCSAPVSCLQQVIARRRLANRSSRERSMTSKNDRSVNVVWQRDLRTYIRSAHCSVLSWYLESKLAGLMR